MDLNRILHAFLLILVIITLNKCCCLNKEEQNENTDCEQKIKGNLKISTANQIKMLSYAKKDDIEKLNSDIRTLYLFKSEDIEDFEFFKKLNKLENLFLMSSKIKDEDFKYLSKNLKSLSLVKCNNIIGNGLTHISDTNLEEIILSDCSNLEDISALEKFKSIKKIKLVKCKITKRQYESFNDFYHKVKPITIYYEKFEE